MTTNRPTVRVLASGMSQQTKSTPESRRAKMKPAFQLIRSSLAMSSMLPTRRASAVNTASQLESSGMVGKVNISETLYQIIKDEDCFSFEYRGYIPAKGKGEAAMYFVEKSNVA
jgi:adenylate cyclase